MIESLFSRLEERFARQSDPDRRAVAYTPGTADIFPNRDASLESLLRSVGRAAKDRPAFFSRDGGLGINQTADALSWHIDARSDLPCSGTAIVQFAPARRKNEAVVIVPHLNSQRHEFGRFRSVLEFAGYGNVRTILPFHDGRLSPDHTAKDQMVSPNLGRTIACVRQAVVETNAVAMHLRSQGYEKVHIVGASIGSCIATICGATSNLFDSVSLLLMADDFASVLWRGRATTHFRQELDGKISLEVLQQAWDLLHPHRYAGMLAARNVPVLMVTAKHDAVMPPDLGRRAGQCFLSEGVGLNWKTLTCGHYSLGIPPFNLMALRLVLKHLKRHGAT